MIPLADAPVISVGDTVCEGVYLGDVRVWPTAAPTPAHAGLSYIWKQRDFGEAQHDVPGDAATYGAVPHRLYLSLTDADGITRTDNDLTAAFPTGAGIEIRDAGGAVLHAATVASAFDGQYVDLDQPFTNHGNDIPMDTPILIVRVT